MDTASAENSDRSDRSERSALDEQQEAGVIEDFCGKQQMEEILFSGKVHGSTILVAARSAKLFVQGQDSIHNAKCYCVHHMPQCTLPPDFSFTVRTRTYQRPCAKNNRLRWTSAR